MSKHISIHHSAHVRCAVVTGDDHEVAIGNAGNVGTAADDDRPFETVDVAQLDDVSGGILPWLIAGAAAAGAAWYFGGGINVGIANGDNNRVAVGNQGPTTLGDNSPVR